MKVTSSKSDTQFQPVSITITFESQQELDVYGSLFNTSNFTRLLKNLNVTPIPFDTFEELGAKICTHVNYISDKIIH